MSPLITATVFAVGCCYFWPTMLGVAAERFPDAGAWGLAVMGGAGNLAVALILPGMGRIYDVSGPQMALRLVVLLFTPTAWPQRRPVDLLKRRRFWSAYTPTGRSWPLRLEDRELLAEGEDSEGRVGAAPEIDATSGKNCNDE